MMKIVKKILKVIGTILLVLVILLILLTAGLFISDRVQRTKEEKLLTDSGYLNLVDAGDYRLNVCSFGSDEPKHTIVGISGMGVNNYSVGLRGVTDRFTDENRVVFVDRAGYGLSDDTKLPQTTERVVEDYRTALKNAGIAPPYVIIPHSLGGIYTSYWVSKYPEEIEGIVYLDCTQCLDNEETFDYMSIDFSDRIFAFLCKLGYQRPMMPMLDSLAFAEAPEGLEEINEAVLNYHGYTNAMISETLHANRNCYESYLNTVKTDVPKLYIASGSAMFTEQDVYDMIALIDKFTAKSGGKKRKTPSEEAVRSVLADGDEFRRTVVVPYVESLGNCELKYLNGTHMLYTHIPDETAELVGEFLESLDEKGDKNE